MSAKKDIDSSRGLGAATASTRPPNRKARGAMTLQKKLAISLLAGIVVVVPIAQYFEYYHSRASSAHLAQVSTQLLMEREQQNIEGIHAGISLAVCESLAKGDMSIFDEVVKLQKELPGLAEFSLYNEKGVVTYSSDKSALRKSIDPALRRQLEASPKKLMKVGSDQTEIFAPQIAQQKCLECHSDYKPGQLCGVTYFRFQNDVAKHLNAEMEAAGKLAARQSFQDAILAFVMQAVVIGGLILLCSYSMARAIRAIGRHLNENSERLKMAARILATSSQTIAEGAGEQAASLEETSSSLEEMASMTKQTAARSLDANKLANQTRDAAREGAAEMHQMSQSMEEIKSASDDISKIIKTIDEIAFNTNILALNAAVEAARVGEAGLGFAVVANEVRSLAQRCKQSASETSEKIQSAITKTSTGVVITRAVAARLQDIVNKAQQVDGLVNEVSAASNEQSQGIVQLTTAVSQLDQVTQRNAAEAQETARAAEELTHDAESLNLAVSDLMALVESAERPLSQTAGNYQGGDYAVSQT